ncbi:MAG: Homeodomain-like domain [Solirubrobacteraceae bacterium]
MIPGARDARDARIAELRSQGLSIGQVADKIGCSRATVQRALRRHSEGNYGDSEDSYGDPNLVDDPARLRRAYVDDNMSQYTIAALSGVARGTVQARLETHGIRRPEGPTILVHDDEPDPARLEDREWLAEAYLDRHLSQAEIGAMVGRSASTVGVRLRQHGIMGDEETIKDAPELDEDERREESRLLLDDPDFLEQIHNTSGRSIREIGEELSVSPSTVRRALVKHEITRDWEPRWRPAHERAHSHDNPGRQTATT